MGKLTIAEIEELRDNPFLYESFKKIIGAINRIPIIQGEGNPNGAVAARPGTLYIPADPLLGESVYQKIAGTDEMGWSAPINGLSGLLRIAVVYANSTTSATFVKGKEILFIPPANARSLALNVTVTGNGGVRLKIQGTNIYSNELAANGVLTLFSIPNTARVIEIEVKANAGTFTADITVFANLLLSGDQVSGARADSASAGGEGGQPTSGTGGNPDDYPIPVGRFLK